MEDSFASDLRFFDDFFLSESSEDFDPSLLSLLLSLSSLESLESLESSLESLESLESSLESLESLEDDDASLAFFFASFFAFFSCLRRASSSLLDKNASGTSSGISRFGRGFLSRLVADCRCTYF